MANKARHDFDGIIYCLYVHSASVVYLLDGAFSCHHTESGMVIIERADHVIVLEFDCLYRDRYMAGISRY